MVNFCDDCREDLSSLEPGQECVRCGKTESNKTLKDDRGEDQ